MILLKGKRNADIIPSERSLFLFSASGEKEAKKVLGMWIRGVYNMAGLDKANAKLANANQILIWRIQGCY